MFTCRLRWRPPGKVQGLELGIGLGLGPNEVRGAVPGTSREERLARTGRQGIGHQDRRGRRVLMAGLAQWLSNSEAERLRG